MTERRQEKLGWSGGWSGGFVWVLILSGVLLYQGETARAAVGLAITLVAGLAIWLAAPWRHPRTPYRLLLVPVYLVFFAAIGWGAWSWGGFQAMGFRSWWSLLILLPILSPFWTVGNRRWEDGKAPSAPGGGE